MPTEGNQTPQSTQPSTQEHKSATQGAAPEVVRAPLAVPTAFTGAPRAGGFGAMPRLGSLRTTPDLSLGGPSVSPRPAFAPLIPSARAHSRKMAGEKIDRQLPGAIPSLLQGEGRRGAGGLGAPRGRGRGGPAGARRTNAVFVRADELGGFLPSGVHAGDGRRGPGGAGLLQASTIARESARAAKREDGADALADVAAAGADALAAAPPPPPPPPPDFDPWDPNEPIQLPLTDPREPSAGGPTAAAAAAAGAGGGAAAGEHADVTALGLPRTADETMRRAPDPRRVPFHDGFGELLNDDQLFMVQLPSQLPYRHGDGGGGGSGSGTGSESASAEAAARARRAATAAAAFEKQHEFETPPFRGNLAGMEGFVGRLQVHRSGRVTLRLTNGVTFDVERGSDPRFLEELFVVSQPSQQCFRLGSIAQHVMVMPNTDSLGLTADTEAQLRDLALHDPDAIDADDTADIRKPDAFRPATGVTAAAAASLGDTDAMVL